MGRAGWERYGGGREGNGCGGGREGNGAGEGGNGAGRTPGVPGTRPRASWAASAQASPSSSDVSSASIRAVAAPRWRRASASWDSVTP